MPTSSALGLADHTSLSPDTAGGFAYFELYHDRGALVDPLSHAIALLSQDCAPNAGIPVIPIHEERIRTMLKDFPRMPYNSYTATTTEIANAVMRTAGNLPMVELGAPSIEAFLAIRHWVYTQDRRSLVEALLGKWLATSLNPETFSIHKPELESRQYHRECCEAFSLSIASASLGGSGLMEAADRVTEVVNLATTWLLLNDDFWAVLIALERIIPVARESCRRILKRRIDQESIEIDPPGQASD